MSIRVAHGNGTFMPSKMVMNFGSMKVMKKITITTPVTIDDHNGGTVTPNIVVTLNGANDNPIALPDSNGTAKNSTLSVSAANGVLANDTDPDVHDNGHLGVSAVDVRLFATTLDATIDNMRRFRDEVMAKLG